MNLKNTIHKLVLLYPSFYDSRVRLLSNFFIHPAEYKWKKGQLISEDLKIPFRKIPEEIEKKQGEYQSSLLYNNRELVAKKVISEQLLWDHIFKEKKRDDEIRRMVDKFWTPYDWRGHSSSYEGWTVFPHFSFRDHLFNPPKDIRADWEKGRQEMFDIILKSNPNAYSLDRATNQKIYHNIASKKIIERYLKEGAGDYIKEMREKYTKREG